MGLVALDVKNMVVWIEDPQTVALLRSFVSVDEWRVAIAVQKLVVMKAEQRRQLVVVDVLVARPAVSIPRLKLPPPLSLAVSA
jgi:hypothetical protein